MFYKISDYLGMKYILISKVNAINPEGRKLFNTQGVGGPLCEVRTNSKEEDVTAQRNIAFKL